MKEARVGTLLVGVFFGVALTAAVDLFAMQFRVHYSALIRDCSMTRVHIIDDNTLISCTVLKVNRTETPVQDNKKPEISL
jgi:hypothetical protein